MLHNEILRHDITSFWFRNKESSLVGLSAETEKQMQLSIRKGNFQHLKFLILENCYFFGNIHLKNAFQELHNHFMETKR
jgi:hypothetical protein